MPCLASQALHGILFFQEPKARPTDTGIRRRAAGWPGILPQASFRESKTKSLTMISVMKRLFPSLSRKLLFEILPSTTTSAPLLINRSAISACFPQMTRLCQVVSEIFSPSEVLYDSEVAREHLATLLPLPVCFTSGSCPRRPKRRTELRIALYIKRVLGSTIFPYVGKTIQRCACLCPQVVWQTFTNVCHTIRPPKRFAVNGLGFIAFHRNSRSAFVFMRLLRGIS